jgi:hypothetical protein
MPEEKKINETFAAEKCIGDFEEFANRLLRKLDKLHQSIDETMPQLLAKMQAVQEMGEIYRQARQSLQEGWTRGLSREQAREVLSEKYNEELLARLRNFLDQTAEGWEKLRLQYLELIKWSNLPDQEQEKWLELYSQPRPRTNLIEGAEYASQTQEHPQESQP